MGTLLTRIDKLYDLFCAFWCLHLKATQRFSEKTATTKRMIKRNSNFLIIQKRQ